MVEVVALVLVRPAMPPVVVVLALPLGGLRPVPRVAERQRVRLVQRVRRVPRTA